MGKYFLKMGLTMAMLVNLSIHVSPAKADTEIFIDGHPYFFEFAFLTNKYNYNTSEFVDSFGVISERASPEILAQFEESYQDVNNLKLALGFQLNPDFQIKLSRTIDVDNLYVTPSNSSENGFTRFETDITLLELDFIYRVFKFSDALEMAISGGLASSKNELMGYQDRDNGATVSFRSTDKEIIGKVGLSLDYHWTRHFSLILGYQKYNDFLSMENLSLTGRLKF